MAVCDNVCKVSKASSLMIYGNVLDDASTTMAFVLSTFAQISFAKRVIVTFFINIFRSLHFSGPKDWKKIV